MSKKRLKKVQEGFPHEKLTCNDANDDQSDHAHYDHHL